VWCRRLALLVVLGAVLSACADDTADAGSRQAFCTELRAAVEADLTVFDPLEPVSPDETRAAMDRLAVAAPDAIADEIALLDESFAAVTEVLDRVGLADPEAAAEIEALDLDPEEIAAAQEAVSGYARQECGIDLAAINAASTGTTLPPTTPAPTTVPPTTVPPTSVPPTSLPPTTSPPG
jgi:hypothetical protein